MNVEQEETKMKHIQRLLTEHSEDVANIELSRSWTGKYLVAYSDMYGGVVDGEGATLKEAFKDLNRQAKDFLADYD